MKLTSSIGVSESSLLIIVFVTFEAACNASQHCATAAEDAAGDDYEANNDNSNDDLWSVSYSICCWSAEKKSFTVPWEINKLLMLLSLALAIGNAHIVDIRIFFILVTVFIVHKDCTCGTFNMAVSIGGASVLGLGLDLDLHLGHQWHSLDGGGHGEDNCSNQELERLHLVN